MKSLLARFKEETVNLRTFSMGQIQTYLQSGVDQHLAFSILKTVSLPFIGRYFCTGGSHVVPLVTLWNISLILLALKDPLTLTDKGYFPFHSNKANFFVAISLCKAVI